MMDEAGVDRVDIVIVPPTLEGERLDYAQEAVSRFPGRFAIMARMRLDRPVSVQRVEALNASPAWWACVSISWVTKLRGSRTGRQLVLAGS